MTAIDLDGLLRPVTEDAPAGPDLEYDPAYLEAFRTSLGAPERRMGDTVVAAEEPDWRQVQALAGDLLTRSKDLRVAVLLTRALSHLQGLEGLAAGLALIRDMLARYWDQLHPHLDPEDGNDPTARVNSLLDLCDREHLLDCLRTAPLVRSPVFGPLAYRDIEVSEGKISPSPGGKALDAATVNAIFQDCDVDALKASASAAASARDQVRAILDTLAAQIRTDQLPNLDPLAEVLAAIGKTLQSHLALRLPETTDSLESETSESQPDAGTGVAMAPGTRTTAGQIGSRDDVVRAIDRICDYYSRYEPSSPVPLLLQRARRLATGSFVDIVRDLAPGALAEIEKVCGLGEKPN
jgi:type VI secretion system protein ImpA